jgi:hypothetical protein
MDNSSSNSSSSGVRGRLTTAIAELKEIADFARDDVREMIRSAAQILECAKSILVTPMAAVKKEKSRPSEAMEGGSRCTIWRKRSHEKQTTDQPEEAAAEFAAICNRAGLKAK